MVSGYVQAGLDKEALELFHEMQAAGKKLDKVILTSALSACAQLGALDQGRWIHAHIKRSGMQIDPILGCALMDMYAKCGDMEEAIGIVHEFLAGDRTHPEADTIYSTWHQIADRLRQEGYKPVTRELMLDLEDSEKEIVVSQHSEKLAITFGLIHGKPGTVIRIFKNLRVCEDCHTAMKLISRIYNRQIVMRDRTRFHCFRDGECSCADYW
ncbi:Pentatricopeptide repeat-containing protein At5g66520 [Linum perenne]